MKLTVNQALEKAKKAGQGGNLSNAATIYRTPAALTHYTIPFQSDERRIVLAFDVVPGR